MQLPPRTKPAVPAPPPPVPAQRPPTPPPKLPRTLHTPLTLPRAPLAARQQAATMPDIVKQLDAKLRAVVDYEAVSTDVADYNQLSFKAWMGRTPDWKQAMCANTHPGPPRPALPRPPPSPAPVPAPLRTFAPCWRHAKRALCQAPRCCAGFAGCEAAHARTARGAIKRRRLLWRRLPAPHRGARAAAHQALYAHPPLATPDAHRRPPVPPPALRCAPLLCGAAVLCTQGGPALEDALYRQPERACTCYAPP